MANKLTKKDYFKMLLDVIEVNSNDELVKFINHEIDLLNKKRSATAPSKTQIENVEIKEKIKNALALVSTPITISELQENSEELKEYSNQKISALLKQLVDTKEVIRTVNKRKTYFALAD